MVMDKAIPSHRLAKKQSAWYVHEPNIASIESVLLHTIRIYFFKVNNVSKLYISPIPKLVYFHKWNKSKWQQSIFNTADIRLQYGT